jgi:hypothetical protein
MRVGREMHMRALLLAAFLAVAGVFAVSGTADAQVYCGRHHRCVTTTPTWTSWWYTPTTSYWYEPVAWPVVPAWKAWFWWGY